jgi:hypothetical protein
MGPVSTLDRRAFMRGLAAVSASTAGLVLLDGCGPPLSADRPRRVPRIGYIGDPPDSPWVTGLWDGLRELGWVEGHTLTVERRDQPGATHVDSEIAVAVAELVALPLDALVTIGTPITLAAKQAADTLPIVFISGMLLGDETGRLPREPQLGNVIQHIEHPA